MFEVFELTVRREYILPTVFKFKIPTSVQKNTHIEIIRVVYLL